MIEFRNEFHGTLALSRKRAGDLVSRAFARHVWRKLCGVQGCACCGDGGVRGGRYGFEPWSADDEVAFQIVDRQADTYRGWSDA
jgi:hypothetical protein